MTWKKFHEEPAQSESVTETYNYESLYMVCYEETTSRSEKIFWFHGKEQAVKIELLIKDKKYKNVLHSIFKRQKSTRKKKAWCK